MFLKKRDRRSPSNEWAHHSSFIIDDENQKHEGWLTPRFKTWQHILETGRQHVEDEVVKHTSWITTRVTIILSLLLLLLGLTLTIKQSRIRSTLKTTKAESQWSTSTIHNESLGSSTSCRSRSNCRRRKREWVRFRPRLDQCPSFHNKPRCCFTPNIIDNDENGVPEIFRSNGGGKHVRCRLCRCLGAVTGRAGLCRHGRRSDNPLECQDHDRGCLDASVRTNDRHHARGQPRPIRFQQPKS